DVMVIFKHRKKGGLGFGPKSEADGIEYKLGLLEKKLLLPRQLKAEGKELLRMAYVVRAVAEVTHAYPPDRAPAKVKAWQRFDADMKAGADELVAAIKKADGRAIRKAATRLNGNCVECHNDFRNK